MSNLEDDKLVELLEIAASNPDLVQFQQMLNNWLKSICSCSNATFFVHCRDSDQYLCQVIDSQNLPEPFSLGPYHEVNETLKDKTELDWKYLNEEQRDSLATLSQRTTESEKSAPATEGTSLTAAELLGPKNITLLPISAKSNGLIAVLCIFHRDGSRTDWCWTVLHNYLPGLCWRSAPSAVEEDLTTIRPHIKLICSLLAIVLNVAEQKRLAQQSAIFLEMAQNVFSSLDDMTMLVRNITKEAKTLVRAETCSLFLLDKEHRELVAEVFEKNGRDDEYLKEIRLPIDQGIVGQVAATGQMINVRDAYSNPSFYKKVDERTGFHTRNILCFPIKDSAGDVVGVAELCNKIGGPSFTTNDEQIAATFSVYCAISISHCLLYRKLQETNRRSHLASELMVYDSQLKIAEEDVLRLSIRPILPLPSLHSEFPEWTFLPRKVEGGDAQLDACMTMFDDLGFCTKWRIRKKTLSRFLLMVQKGYREVPYHNWSHAFAVTHFAYLLLKTQRIIEYLTDLERISFLVAALCHDIDHRGTNNAFQLKSKTPLAQLYSSEGSVLERHHFAQTMCILNMEECNVFENLSAKEYHQVLDHIRDIILATDIAQHLLKVAHLKSMIKRGYNKANKSDHYLLLSLMMTSCDLSDQTKDWPASKAIAANIYTEFFSQGDLEKAMGNNPIEMMDRERACVPKLQVDFLDTVAIPIYEMLSDIVNQCEPVYRAICFSRKCWGIMEDLLQKGELVTPEHGSLDILRDKGLEQRILELTDEQGKSEKEPDTQRSSISS